MPPFDRFENVDGPTVQGRTATLVTPNDSADLAESPKALLIGGTAGNIAIDAVNGATNMIIPVVAGQLFDAVRVRRVRATGTTATPIYAIS